MFCGDWHHNRNSVNITTMDASIRCLEKIGKAFDKFYFFPGNHDLYFKDSRSIQSTEFGRFIPGITMVNEIMNVDDVVMVPWLVGDEWRKVGKMKCKYMFGHFELPNFFMNAMVEMPDTGELKGSDFQNQEYVFSGHFHKRQVKNNIHYLGNAFPHNYADVDDNDRGMMILEWDKEPRYLNWHDCPKYKYVKLSELLDKTKEIMQPKIHLRVTLDIDISYEEASFIKETFMKEYDCREITLIPSKKDEEINSDLDLTKFESVDEIVAKELDSIESDNYNKKTLMDIYNDLG
jgi:hypothetical protein